MAGKPRSHSADNSLNASSEDTNEKSELEKMVMEWKEDRQSLLTTIEYLKGKIDSLENKEEIDVLTTEVEDISSYDEEDVVDISPTAYIKVISLSIKPFYFRQW
jgi:hypothetical protein